MEQFDRTSFLRLFLFQKNLEGFLYCALLSLTKPYFLIVATMWMNEEC